MIKLYRSRKHFEVLNNVELNHLTGIISLAKEKLLKEVIIYGESKTAEKQIKIITNILDKLERVRYVIKS